MFSAIIHNNKIGSNKREKGGVERSLVVNSNPYRGGTCFTTQPNGYVDSQMPGIGVVGATLSCL